MISFDWDEGWSEDELMIIEHSQIPETIQELSIWETTNPRITRLIFFFGTRMYSHVGLLLFMNYVELCCFIISSATSEAISLSSTFHN